MVGDRELTGGTDVRFVAYLAAEVTGDFACGCVRLLSTLACVVCCGCHCGVCGWRGRDLGGKMERSNSSGKLRFFTLLLINLIIIIIITAKMCLLPLLSPFKCQ